MTPSIHPSAIVDTRAELCDDVVIGARCVVEGPVRLGRGTVLHPTAVVLGDTVMGEANEVFPGAVVGATPQDLKYKGEPVQVRMGDRNQLREHVTVHAGTAGGGSVTRIGSDCLLMVAAHVGHDALIGDRVLLGNNVLLGGHVHVHDRAILNGAAGVHHFTTIGRLAYVGGNSRITQDVHPFTITAGDPSRVRACNVIGMRRSGLDDAVVAAVRKAIFRIFLSKRTTAEAAIRALEAEQQEAPLIAELLASIRAADAGRQGRSLEAGRVISR